MEQEHDLLSATEESQGAVDPPLADSMDRMLSDQHARLGANIALLEQRFEMLPTPERFHVLNRTRRPAVGKRRIQVRNHIFGERSPRHSCARG